MGEMKVINLFIDLFCGAGGTTTGVHEAEYNGEKIAEVVVCVNHDKNAILSHFSNYPDCKHITEDIRTVPMSKIMKAVQSRKAFWENRGYVVILHLWASLECTNFSNAKGGLPRNADSRTLADHLFRYIDFLKPHYIRIENVEEFMSWGPLDENGKPIHKKEGIDYKRWVTAVNDRGYSYDYKILNSADFGEYTSRKRYFGVFAAGDLPITWPQPTHTKNPDSSPLFGSILKKWEPVKHCLDFNDEGKSIFTRKKDLSEKTLQRIYAGLIRYVAGGVITTKFLAKYYSTGENIQSIDEACPTITTRDRFSLIQTVFSMDNQLSAIPIYESDSETMIKIKEFMALYNMADIKMRMLKVSELLKIQGFPEGYKLIGNQSDQKKFIGNSVTPKPVKYMIEKCHISLKEFLKQAA